MYQREIDAIQMVSGWYRNVFPQFNPSMIYLVMEWEYENIHSTVQKLKEKQLIIQQGCIKLINCERK